MLGRARRLCPGISDINLFRYRKSVVDLDAKVPDGALDFGVTEQELNRPQVARAPINQGCLRSPTATTSQPRSLLKEVEDVAPNGHTIDRATVRQKNTGRPVKFELTDQTRQAINDYLKAAAKKPGEFLFSDSKDF